MFLRCFACPDLIELLFFNKSFCQSRIDQARLNFLDGFDQ
jgi:hypothetical protein